MAIYSGFLVMTVWFQVMLLALSSATQITNPEEKGRNINDGNPPHISGLKRELVDAVEGEKHVLLSCQVQNGGPAWLNWYKNGEKIDMRNNLYVRSQRGLKLRNIRLESAGEYMCKLTTDTGVDRKVLILQVHDKPDPLNTGPLKWLSPSHDENTNIFVSPEGVATFKCDVRGEPNIHAEWFESGEPLGDRLTSRKNVKYRNDTVGNHTTMIMRGVRSKDNGQKITCLVRQTTALGETRNLTRTFTLLVKGGCSFPPVIVNDNFKPLVAYKGDNFTYECRLLKPELLERYVYFFWSKYFGVDEETKLMNVTNLNFDATLSLYDTRESDAGQYMCAVSNRIDFDYKIFNLTVADMSREPDMSKGQ